MITTSIEKNIPKWMNDHPRFVRWWKEHRHSGFCEDRERYSHWSIPPWVAFHCDKYQAEYSSDTGIRFKPKYEYEAREIELWAKDQQRAVASGSIPTTEEFVQQIRKTTAVLSNKFKSINK
jgi:hypothetical protein